MFPKDACRRALHTYKRTGQTFHHVSVDSSILFSLVCCVDFSALETVNLAYKYTCFKG